MTVYTNRLGKNSSEETNLIFEEDIEIAHQHAVSILGPMGRMVYPATGNLVNIALFHPAYGKVWYGDLMTDEIYKVIQLQSLLGVKLDIIET